MASPLEDSKMDTNSEAVQSEDVGSYQDEKLPNYGAIVDTDSSKSPADHITKTSQDDHTNPAEQKEPSHAAPKVSEKAVQDVLEQGGDFPGKEYCIEHSRANSGSSTTTQTATPPGFTTHQARRELGLCWLYGFMVFCVYYYKSTEGFKLKWTGTVSIVSFSLAYYINAFLVFWYIQEGCSDNGMGDARYSRWVLGHSIIKALLVLACGAQVYFQVLKESANFEGFVVALAPQCFSVFLTLFWFRLSMKPKGLPDLQKNPLFRNAFRALDESMDRYEILLLLCWIVALRQVPGYEAVLHHDHSNELGKWASPWVVMPLTVLYYTFFVGATFFMQKVCFMVCGKKCASLCVNNVVLTACISAVVLGWKFESVIVHLPYTYSLWLSVMWMWLRFYGIPRMPCDQKLAGAETQV